MLRTIKDHVGVEVVIPHSVSAETGNVLRQTAVYYGGSSRGGRPIATDPGKSPGGSAIPQILDRRIVVEVETVDKFFAPNRPLSRVADVGVINAEMIVLSVIGDLHKAADMLGPGTRQEQRNILRHFKAAVLRTGDRRFEIGK